MRLVITKKQLEMFIAILIIIIGQIAEIINSESLVLFTLFISIISSFLCRDRDIFPFMLLFIAPNRLLTYGPISVPTIIMLIGVLKKIYFLRKLNTNFYIYGFGLIAFSIMTIGMGNSQFFSALKIIIVLLFLQIYTDTDNIEIEYQKYVIYCSTGCLISAISALVLNPSSIQENSRFALTDSGQNVLGILCAIMTINIAYIFIRSNNYNKLYLACFGCSLTLIGLMTGSRSFLMALSIGIGSIIIFLIVHMQVKRLIKIIIILSVGIIIFLIIYRYNSIINDFVSSLIYRINKLQGADVSNGRYELWDSYISVFLSNPLILWFGNLNPSIYGIEAAAHNMIIEQIAAYGLIGSIIIFFLYKSTFDYIKTKSKAELVWNEAWAGIISLLSVSMVSHTLLGIPQTIMLYISALAILKCNRRGNL